MNARTLGYWSTTALLSLAMFGSAAGKLSQAEPIVESMTHLGLPMSISTILGVWVAMGAVALLAPGFGRIKEWAYAGLTFAFTGAIASHVAIGHALSQSVPAMVLLGLLAVSYKLQAHRAMKSAAAPHPTAA